MGDYFLEYRPDIEQDDGWHLQEVLDRLGQDDHVTIVVDATDAHETDQLLEVLDDRGFDYQSKGGDGVYFITAKKRTYFH